MIYSCLGAVKINRLKKKSEPCDLDTQMERCCGRTANDHDELRLVGAGS